MSSRTEESAPSWADPGYFREQSRLANAGRVMWQMIRPPKGHRTLPTKSGAMLILISLGIGTAAFNTSHNILYLALSLLLSSLLLSGVMSWLNFKGCRWRIRTEPHMRVEEPSPVMVEVENLKSWLPTYGLWFRLQAMQAEERALIAQEGRLEPGAHLELEWLFTPSKRGVEVVRLDGVVSKFPFGFLQKSITDSFTREVLVWPSRIDYQFEHGLLRDTTRQGAWRSRAGVGTELLKLRPYRPGDPPRQVHWKASARQGKLLVREMAEESEASFVLVVQASSRLWKTGPQLEKLCAFAGSLAEDLFIKRLLGGTSLNGEPVQPIRRTADVHAFLSALARLEPKSVKVAAESFAPLIPLTFKPDSGDRVSCWLHGERIGEA
jgi:uncharacterized protein (DUF58 family)